MIRISVLWVLLGLSLLLIAWPLLLFAAGLSHVQVNITTSSQVIVPAAGSRQLLILQNDSDVTIYCKLDGSTAVAGQGLRLDSGGGSVFFDQPASMPKADVTCIHGGTGNKSLLATRVD